MDERLIGCDRDVVFELASGREATALYLGLVDGRTTWQVEADGIWIVGAEVGEGDDLAVLLRRVERWVAERGLGALRYWVDGRDYVLAAGAVRWAAAVLAA